jgi:protein-tyrosine phosphatase
MENQPRRPIPDSYWVVPNQLLAGEYPGAYTAEDARKKLQRFLDAGITVFVDLTEEGELSPYRLILEQEAEKRGLDAEHRRLAIPDVETPTREDMVGTLDTIDEALEQGYKVYVHCWGGLGRTGAVVGCYLVRHGWAPTEALAEIARRRRGLEDGHKRSPETDEQRTLVLSWREGE